MVRVIGAGLSGLAAAWCLTEAGHDVEVLEAASGPGGLIETTRTPHGPVERAANAFLWNETTAAWFEELDLTPSRPVETARKRYIFRNGVPRRWPLTTAETAELAARAALAAVRGRLNPGDVETVAEWSTRIGGRATTRWLVAPALQGIYAAPAARLSARAVLGTRVGRRRSSRRPPGPRLAAPAGGMGEFIERLFDRLRARGVAFAFSCPAAGLDPSIPTIVATPAPAAARLLEPHAPRLAAAIARVSMTSVASATAFFPRTTADLRGFGVLFPRESGVRALGVLFNTDIFDGRGEARSETWIYGSLGGELPLPTHAELPSWIEGDRRILVGADVAPLAIVPPRPQIPALPLYDQAIAGVQERLADLPPWLAVAGNYLGRLGVAKLLDVARESAARIDDNLPPRH